MFSLKYGGRALEIFRVKPMSLSVDDVRGPPTIHFHVHRVGPVSTRIECPHPECVVKDVIES